jgi:hypothetical protein
MRKLTEARASIAVGIEDLQDLLDGIESDICRLNDEREEVLTAMNRTFKAVIDRVARPYTEQETEMGDLMTQLNGFATSAQRCVAEAETVMASDDPESSAPALMSIGQTIDDIKGEIERLVIEPGCVPTSASELVPEFEYFEMVVENFMELSQKHVAGSTEDARFVYSPKFHLYGAGWRLKVYPGGNGNGVGTNLSVFVELLEGVKDRVSIVYQLVLVNASRPESPLTRSYTSTFKFMDAWGWNKLVPLTEIGNYVSENGSLKLKLGIRPETYIEAVKMARSQQKLLDARLEKIGKDSGDHQHRSAHDARRSSE